MGAADFELIAMLVAGSIVALSIGGALLWAGATYRLGELVGWPILGAWFAVAVAVPMLLIGHTFAVFG